VDQIVENGVLMAMACAEHTLALENAPIGPVPGSLGLEDGKDVEKTTRILGRGSAFVIIAKVSSLDRFQAQLIWDIPA
jgi:hypothetical protein